MGAICGNAVRGHLFLADSALVANNQGVHRNHAGRQILTLLELNHIEVHYPSSAAYGVRGPYEEAFPGTSLANRKHHRHPISQEGTAPGPRLSAPHPRVLDLPTGERRLEAHS